MLALAAVRGASGPSFRGFRASDPDARDRIGIACGCAKLRSAKVVVGWAKALLRRAHHHHFRMREIEWWAHLRTHSRPAALPTLRIWLALVRCARRQPPGFRGFRAADPRCTRSDIREFRVDFTDARFLKQSDYASMLRMQAMMAPARLGCGASRLAFSDSAHSERIHGIG
jgi:hypothetical protein